MKRNLQKIFLPLTSLLMVATVMLTACSGSSSKKTAGTAAKTNLVYWSMWNENEPQAKVLKEAVSSFDSANPGVNIHIEWIGRDITKTLPPALLAGQKIDMWDQDSGDVFSNFKDYVLKLDSYYDKTYPTTGGKAYKDVVIPALVNLDRSHSPDGGIYDVAYQPYMMAWFYNKDQFKKAGITSVPTTWTDFVDVCAKLKAAGFTPITSDAGYIDEMLGYQIARYIGSKGTEDLVNDKTGAKWDNPMVMQAVNDIAGLVAKGYISKSVANNKEPAGQVEIATGKASMYVNGTWMPNEEKAVAGENFNWGEFAYPSVTNGLGGGITANDYGSQCFMIYNKSKAPDVAFSFCVYMTTGKYDQELSSETLGIPMGLDAVWPKQISDEKAIFASLKTAYPYASGIEANSDKLTIIGSNFTKLLAGQINTDTFINNVKSNKQ